MSKDVQQKIDSFFTETISEKEFAKHIRRFKYFAVKMALESNDDFKNKEWISDGHYWLTELCEILDPQLEEN